VPRLRPWFILAVLIGFAGSAQAQQPEVALGIKPHPRGHLSREQLQAVAKDIHALEANPLASDVMEARRALLIWLIESPDVTVKVCPGLEQPFTESNSRYHSEMMGQLIFSSAAYVIEHPDQARDLARVGAGGLEGVLTTYAVLKAQQGDAATDEFVERLASIRERGGLEEFARQATTGC